MQTKSFIPLMLAGALLAAAPIAGAAQLEGTWQISVASDPGPNEYEPFLALQTFHKGGTVTETTNLLATLTEGPGHGVWEGTGRQYSVVFVLYVFTPDGGSDGMIRVRETIELQNNRRLTGYAIADYIAPDGTVFENVGSGPIEGVRLQIK